MEQKKINNVAELRLEIRRLRELSEVQEQVIREDVAEIKENLNPKNIILNALESITGIRLNKRDAFAGGITASLLLTLRKYLSKAESKAEEKVYDVTDRIFERIRHFLSRFMHVRKHYAEDSGKEKE